MRINKRKCNEFPNMLNCLPNKETYRTREVQGGAGHEGNTEREREKGRQRAGLRAKHVCNRYAKGNALGGVNLLLQLLLLLLGVLLLLPQSGLVAHSTMPVIKIEVEALNLTVLNEAAAPRCVDRGGEKAAPVPVPALTFLLI